MSRAAAAWDRFWFTPAPTATLALLRIGVGGLAFASALTLWPVASPFYGPTWLGVPGARALVAVLAVAAIGVAVGAATRAAAVVALLCLVALSGTNPFIFNSGDTLLRLLLLLVAIAPAGTALSLDCRRREGSAWRFPPRPMWSLRLVQLQVAAMYAAAVVHKLGGESWRDGTAVSYPLRIPDMVRFPLPDPLVDSLLVAHVLTWGTLAVEAAIPVLVWSRRARPWVLALGAGLHLGIDVSLRAGLFSWVVLVAYLAFVPPDTAARALERIRRPAAGVWRLRRRTA